MKDIPLFIRFFRAFIVSRLLHFGRNFENIKDIIVAFLIVKRGKYSNSFLNSSLFLLIITALIGGPIIAENSPFANGGEDESEYQQSVISYSPGEYSLGTVISSKPRDKVVEYKVGDGDTLETIAKKFDVSVDTIRWANNDIKNDVIKPGQTVRVPPVTGIVHKVSSGENVYTIAKKYKTDAQKIVNFPFNEFSDLDTFQLTSGQDLFVPDGVVETAQPKQNTGTTYETRATIAQIQAGAKGTSNFIWPTTGIITQYPVWYHMALDIANNALPSVIAADSGTVSYAGCIAWGYGCHVIVDHNNGYQSLYAHLSQITVSAGQSVGQGTQLGIMGSTGRSTGPHLHFEIRSGGATLNPLGFLQ